MDKNICLVKHNIYPTFEFKIEDQFLRFKNPYVLFPRLPLHIYDPFGRNVTKKLTNNRLLTYRAVYHINKYLSQYIYNFHEIRKLICRPRTRPHRHIRLRPYSSDKTPLQPFVYASDAEESKIDKPLASEQCDVILRPPTSIHCETSSQEHNMGDVKVKEDVPPIPLSNEEPTLQVPKEEVSSEEELSEMRKYLDEPTYTRFKVVGNTIATDTSVFHHIIDDKCSDYQGIDEFIYRYNSENLGSCDKKQLDELRQLRKRFSNGYRLYEVPINHIMYCEICFPRLAQSKLLVQASLLPQIKKIKSEQYTVMPLHEEGALKGRIEFDTMRSILDKQVKLQSQTSELGKNVSDTKTTSEEECPKCIEHQDSGTSSFDIIPSSPEDDELSRLMSSIL